MAFYGGQPYTNDTTVIGAPTRLLLPTGATNACSYWPTIAPIRDDIWYFAIYELGALVGAILLHDWDRTKQESLVAYHLFAPSDRGRGIGTRALALLQRVVFEQTNLHTLVILTSDDNRASQRIAEKCGFSYAGPSQEDPLHGMVFTYTRSTE